MRRTRWILIGCALAAGCKRMPAGRPGEELELAEALLKQARAPEGIGPELVDSEVVERVRRIQLVRRTTLDTMQKDSLLAALAGQTGPDRQYPEAVRAAKQRERATRGLLAHAVGQCHARLDEAGTRERLKYLLDPVEGAPDQVRVAQEELGSSLHEATGARLECEHGQVGLLMRRGDDGKLKVVDLWQIGTPPIGLSPDDPSMK